MLKVGRWATLGLISLGTAHLLVTACRESRRNGADAAAYTSSLAVLAAQPLDSRAIEPRVTGGFSYSPYRPGLKSAGKPFEARRRIVDEAQNGASPEALGAEAVALLLDRSPDQALDRLRKALAASPREPRLFSDLAAAYLVRAELKASPYDLVQGLAAADRALEISPRLAEARFNQALALMRLGLGPEAEKAWQAYRDLDTTSPWRDEAEAHLQQLRQPREADLWKGDRDRLDRAALAGNGEEVKRIVAAYRQPARLYIEDQLLGDWAAARKAGRIDESKRSLTIARAVADALGFGMLRREVGVLEQGQHLEALIRGHDLYARARTLHEQQKYPEAEPLFRAAAAALEEGGSPFVAWPAYYLAIIRHHHQNQPQAIGMLEDLRRRFAAEDYAPLLGYIDWMIGQARGTQGPLASALPASESALHEFERAGEVENQAALHSIVAQIYTEFGENEAAWQHHVAALQVLPRLYKPRRSQNILSAALHSLQTMGDLGPAFYFQGMLVDDAVQADNPIGLSIALRDRAAILHKLGRLDEVFSDLDRARKAAGRIGDLLLRQSVEVDTLVAEGRVFRTSRPDAALKALDEALAVSLQQGNRHLLIQILQERAESWLSLGREPEAEKDLKAGLAELEQQRRIVTDSMLRVFFADQGRSLLEEWIALQRRRGERAEATLDTVEGLRARALLDAIGGPGPAGWPEPRTARDIAAALPARTAVVEYLWVRDELIAWIVTRNGVESVTLGSGRERVEDLVHRFVRALKDGQDSTAVARELHHLLIAPLERTLAGASTLIFIPDGELCHLPFAALQEGPEKGFLVETYRLATAPSASVYLTLAERYRERAATPPNSILLAGEPEYDHGLFPDLASLKDAKNEIAALTGLYGGRVLLTGRDATPEKLLSALSPPDVPDVFHFAGHTVTPPGATSPSLLLAPAKRADGVSLLSAEGIRFTKPPRARLAVLAGCRTAEGRWSQNEGTLGLARAFLSAGIPTVVASHWDAADEPTFELLQRFHHYFRAGVDPLTALQQAQLDLLRGSSAALSSPRTWAAFQVIGGAFAPAGDLPPPGSMSH
ncbi:MAG TPA: CHAT domain-containing protein [Thermoanaerobaculia bacterium]|jgi:CHAT domain-containing protein|nr:CHAT domain-containing protein [Thermoanaerobaculia bacterium]